MKELFFNMIYCTGTIILISISAVVLKGVIVALVGDKDE